VWYLDLNGWVYSLDILLEGVLYVSLPRLHEVCVMVMTGV